MKVGDKLWFVPEKGEMFGKNLTSPTIQRKHNPSVSSVLQTLADTYLGGVK